MKFTIMSGELADAIGWAAHALPKRPAMPVLAGLLLQAGDDGVEVAAFDSDTSRQARIDVDAPLDPGRVLVPGRVLADIAKALPRGELVDVHADERELTIRCGRAEYGLPLMPVDDYPSLPPLPDVVGSAAATTFAAAVGQAVSAAGTDDALPMLTGLRVEVSGRDGLIDLAATDRYRMTWRTLEWSPALDAPPLLAAVIPARAVAEVARSLPDGDTVEIGINGYFASFTCAGRRTTVRLLDDQFPAFRDHFNRQDDDAVIAEFDAGVVAKVVRRVALLAERNTAVRLTFSQHGLQVEAGGGEAGRASELTDCQVEGGPIVVGFSPAFLGEALATFTGRVQLRMTGPTRPVLMCVPGDNSYRHIIQPIRLGS